MYCRVMCHRLGGGEVLPDPLRFLPVYKGGRCTFLESFVVTHTEATRTQDM